MPGKAITIFLAGGTSANGVTTVEIMGWSGKVLVCPRTQLSELVQRVETGRTGVYILIGDDPQTSLLPQVYVGQGDSVVKRLVRHDKDATKNFWEHTLVITSKDESLTAAHVRYLESQLINRLDRSRYAMTNLTNPNLPILPEPDQAYMESFLLEVDLLLPVLGFPLTQPALIRIGNQQSPAASQAATPTIPGLALPKNISPIFQLAVDGNHAKAQQIDGQFVVLRDSAARQAHRPSLPDSLKRQRDQLLTTGKVAFDQSNNYWVFTEDVPFGSPSTAAAIVLATPVNGRQAWQDSTTSQTYGQWHSAQVQNAVPVTLSNSTANTSNSSTNQDDDQDADDDTN